MASRGLGSVVLGLGLPLSLFLASAAVVAQTSTGASTAARESDTARFLRYTRALEVSPDRADALKLRQWLTNWAVETPDYTVNVCDVLGLTDAEVETTPHGGELFMQTMYGNAAFQIENGVQADELSKQVAAVESALRAYSAFVAADAKAKVAKFDELIAKRDAGALRAHLAPAVEKCESSLATAAKPEDSGDAPKPEGSDDAPKPSRQLFLGGFLRESHVLYPLKLDGWEMQGEHRYDTPEAGASVRFQRTGDKGGWIDVFFYPVGVLPQAAVTTMAGLERQGLVDTWSKSMASPLDMTTLATFPVSRGPSQGSQRMHDDKAKDITAYAVDFAYVHDGRALSSAMVFTVDRMYAIKFRYSAEASKSTRAGVRQDLEQFARDMLQRVEISNTGGCWSRASAKSAQGTLFEGCTGAEPFQPEVKDDMRELRFEYRAGESAPPARPLRARRSGVG